MAAEETALALLAREPPEVRLTVHFYAWEQWGRGWTVWPAPVSPEPPFRPFLGHYAPPGAAAFDDGRKPTFWSNLVDRLAGRATRTHAASDDFAAWAEELEAIPVPEFVERAEDPAEITVALPEDARVSRETTEQLLLALAAARTPVAFEITGAADGIALQFAVSPEDRAQVRHQVEAHAPEAVLSDAAPSLRERWETAPGESLVADFGLSEEFVCPLAAVSRFDADPLASVVGALAGLGEGELGVLQVLFAPALAPWAGSIMRAATDGAGKSFFADAPEIAKLAAEKVSHPLFGVVLRVAAKSRHEERTIEIARGLAAALRQFTRPGSNELIPLENDGYPALLHEEDFFRRQSRRSGMLWNAAELVSLVHLPSPSLRHPKLRREAGRTKAAPVSAAGHALVLGENVHQSLTRRVTVAAEARLRHMHVVGGTGTGKSTFLLSLIAQDVEQGRGLALLDPHGDLVDEVLGRIPDARAQDVVLVDPAETVRPVGWNILDAHSDLERTLLSSDLVAVFRRLSTSWGDQMHAVFANAILAFLESDRGGTLADLRRFLVEPEYRREFLGTVRDDEVRWYFTKEFPLLRGTPQAPILTRLDAFLRPKPVRALVAARENTLDLGAIMREGKILLVKLAQGLIGEENAALLGALFVAKLHQLVLGRQAERAEERRSFFLYCDEFHHFVTPSMATLLTGARKYGLGLVLAHQELRQLWNRDKDVASAVLANAAVRVVFRVGDEDAGRLAEGFSFFTARELLNLGVGEAVARVDRAEWDFNLKTTRPEPVPEDAARERRERIGAVSRERYGVEPRPTDELREEGPHREREAREGKLAPPAPVRAAPSQTEKVAAPASELQPMPGRAEMETPVPAPRAPPPAPAPPVALPDEPRRPGKGGAQHRYLQELVKRFAESKGYRATVEEAVLGGAGSVDVALEREGRRIACEISVTSTPDYEVRNAAKCLAAGFDEIFVIAPEKKAVTKLRDALAAGLSPEERERVRVMGPDEFFFAIEAGERPAPEAKTVRGYRVKVRYGEPTGDEEERARLIARTVVGAMKRLKDE